MNQIEVSIIVPVFNAVETLDRCINSLLEQQTKWTYEVLLVDDGSTDGSLLRLKEWERRSNYIRVFSKTNGGVSSARNAGIAEAKGHYALFVDSDDWVSPLYVENLRNSVLEGKHGVTFAGYVVETNKGQELRRLKPATYFPEDYHRIIDSRHIYNQGIPWGEIYDLTINGGKSFEFCENVHFGEDLIFLLRNLQRAEYIRFIDVSDYHYVRMESNSLVSRYNSFDSELEGFRKLRDVVTQLQKQYCITDEELRRTKGRLSFFAMRTIKTMYRPGKNYKSRRDRISCLVSGFDDHDRAFIHRFTMHSRGIDKWIGYCLKLRQYSLLDFLLLFYFRLRYSRLGKKYVKRKLLF